MWILLSVVRVTLYILLVFLLWLVLGLFWSLSLWCASNAAAVVAGAAAAFAGPVPPTQ